MPKLPVNSIFLSIYRKEILCVILFAVLHSLSFHYEGLSLLAFVSLVPLFCLIEYSKSAEEALRLGYAAGVVYFSCLLFWVMHVSIVGFAALSIYLGIYIALFAYCARPAIVKLAYAGTPGKSSAWLQAILAASIWVLVEFLRSRVPVLLFPWGLEAYSQWKNLAFIQSAEWIGSFGLSFIIVLANASVYGIYRAVRNFAKHDIGFWRASFQILIQAVLAGSVLFANLSYGRTELLRQASLIPGYPTLRVAVIQGNIPQHEKWDPRIAAMIYNKYEGLSRQAILENPELVIWPETAFPGYWEIEPELAARLTSLIRQLQTRFLVGIPTLRLRGGDEQRMNSSVLFGPHGNEIARYHKLRLVPFGEYVPFFDFLRRFYPIGHFTPGDGPVLMKIKPDDASEPAVFSNLICFEDIFADLSRKVVESGASILVNITNDAWFLDTSAPYQHAQASTLRAVENRVSVVRAANTGLSCVIDPSGRQMSSVKDKGKEIFVTGYLVQDVPIGKQSTFYTRWGDWFVGVSLVLTLLLFRRKL